MDGDLQLLRFGRSEGIPNNPALPVVLMKSVQCVMKDPDACEALIERAGWSGVWRDTVYPFHHFHSNSHEVIAVVSGTARVFLGGPGGRPIDVRVGSVAVLPAGTGHKLETASADFLVVGAYPPGQEQFDLHRGDLDELDKAERTIAAVPLPASDPISGPVGPLFAAWKLTHLA